MAISRAAVVGTVITVVVLGGTFGVVCLREKHAREPFDADSYIADGMKDAPKQARGAELSSIEATFVTPDGRVHTEHRGRLFMTWVAPSKVEATAPVMPGAPRSAGGGCTDVTLSVSLAGDSDGVSLRDHMDSSHDTECWKNTAPGKLHCTIADVWKRAIEARAPNPAMATIKLETTADSRRVWHFTIPGHRFSAEFHDDCH